MKGCFAALLFVVCIGLTACSEQVVEQTEPEVQDINPGDKSVIQPPERTAPHQPGLEERRI